MAIESDIEVLGWGLWIGVLCGTSGGEVVIFGWGWGGGGVDEEEGERRRVKS